MDCSRTSLSNSASSEFSNTDRLTGNSTVEPTSKSLNDGSNKENKVRKRTAYSQAQLKELHTYFNQNAYLDSPQIGHISRRLGITRNQVRKWFQNMRMKRKKQMNVSTQEFQSSKMCHPSVLSPSVTHGVAQPTVSLLNPYPTDIITEYLRPFLRDWFHDYHIRTKVKNVLLFRAQGLPGNPKIKKRQWCDQDLMGLRNPTFQFK
uniref:Homeobox protein LOX10-like n=1 Tax=Phascolarctos cinereus TaxID=38626 RepID=A0A6P5IS99_PHACI|nr:homeobox protein LOX10-like [Phascolarctos cinereus]